MEPARRSPVVLILLLATGAAAAWLVSPFFDALLVAGVAALLAWPLNAALRRWFPRPLATLLALLTLTAGAVAPVAGLLWLVSRELAALAQALATELDAEKIDQWVQALGDLPLVATLAEQAGGTAALTDAARASLLDSARTAGDIVPGLLGLTARAVLKLTIFYVALATAFARGPEMAVWVLRHSPLERDQTRRIFDVFAQFARNVVLAGLVAGAVQGVVAGIGYRVAGVDRPVLFGVLTGVLAFVPIVGSAAAWVPIALLLLLRGEADAALIVTLWSLALTGTVDNFVKPVIVRGRSEMPTLLVFLGVFGGLLAFGIIGLMVGPVLMALLLALIKIHDEQGQ